MTAARPELAQQDPEGAIQRRELGPPPSTGEDGELLAEGQLDDGLLTLAAEAGPQRVEQGDREGEQDHQGGGERAGFRGPTQRIRDSRALRCRA